MSADPVNDRFSCQTDKYMNETVEKNENQNITDCLTNMQVTGKANIIGK